MAPSHNNLLPLHFYGTFTHHLLLVPSSIFGWEDYKHCEQFISQRIVFYSLHFCGEPQLCAILLFSTNLYSKSLCLFTSFPNELPSIISVFIYFTCPTNFFLNFSAFYKAFTVILKDLSPQKLYIKTSVLQCILCDFEGFITSAPSHLCPVTSFIFLCI
jgi:hypothetical protein